MTARAVQVWFQNRRAKWKVKKPSPFSSGGTSAATIAAAATADPMSPGMDNIFFTDASIITFQGLKGSDETRQQAPQSHKTHQQLQYHQYHQYTPQSSQPTQQHQQPLQQRPQQQPQQHQHQHKHKQLHQQLQSQQPQSQNQLNQTRHVSYPQPRYPASYPQSRSPSYAQNRYSFPFSSQAVHPMGSTATSSVASSADLPTQPASANKKREIRGDLKVSNPHTGIKRHNSEGTLIAAIEKEDGIQPLVTYAANLVIGRPILLGGEEIRPPSCSNVSMQQLAHSTQSSRATIPIPNFAIPNRRKSDPYPNLGAHLDYLLPTGGGGGGGEGEAAPPIRSNSLPAMSLIQSISTPNLAGSYSDFSGLSHSHHPSQQRQQSQQHQYQQHRPLSMATTSSAEGEGYENEDIRHVLKKAKSAPNILANLDAKQLLNIHNFPVSETAPSSVCLTLFMEKNGINDVKDLEKQLGDLLMKYDSNSPSSDALFD